MAWTRYDSRYPGNPKVVALSDAAYRLWTSAIAYGNEHCTDGRIPPSALRILLPNSRYPKKAAEELVAARMFHSLPLPEHLPCTSPDCPCSLASISIEPPEEFPDSSIASPQQLRDAWSASRADGWVVHDFWDLQPKSWETRRKTKKRAEAGRQGGLAKPKQTTEALLNPEPDRTGTGPDRTVPLEEEGASSTAPTTTTLAAVPLNGDRPPLPPWKRGEPINNSRHLVNLIEAVGGTPGMGMGQINRNRAKVEQCFASGPLHPGEYEPVIAEILAKKKTPNVGLFLTVLQDHRTAGAVGFTGGFTARPPTPAAQRPFEEDP